MDIMDLIDLDMLDTLEEIISIVNLNRLLYSAAVIILIWLARWTVRRYILDKIEDVTARYWWGKIVNYASFLGGLILITPIWIRGFQTLVTFIGLFSAGVAIALRSMLSNFAGWLFIVWRRPFALGDRIEINDVAGDVVDIRVFQFSVMEIGNWVDADQSTGRIVHIPNGKIFETELANYSAGFRYIWNELPVLVTFESDWEKAKSILRKIADRHAAHLSEKARERVRRAARKFMIFYANLTPIVYTRVEESGVRLTIRYLCEPRNRRGSEELIWEDLLREFAKHDDIELAYPTLRYYSRREERSLHGISREKPEMEREDPGPKTQ